MYISGQIGIFSLLFRESKVVLYTPIGRRILESAAITQCAMHEGKVPDFVSFQLNGDIRHYYNHINKCVTANGDKGIVVAFSDPNAGSNN